MKDWLAIVKQFLLWLTKPRADHAPPASPPSPEQAKTAIFYDLMLRRLEDQSRSFDGLTIRAGNWLSGTGLLIAFPGLLLAAERAELHDDAWTLIRIAGGIYIIGLILVFLSPLGRPWRDGPRWQELANASLDPNSTADDLYYSVGVWLAEETLPANKRKIRGHAIVLYAGLFLVLIGVVMLLGIALWYLPANHMAAADPVRVIVATPTP